MSRMDDVVKFVMDSKDVVETVAQLGKFIVDRLRLSGATAIQVAWKQTLEDILLEIAQPSRACRATCRPLRAK